MFDDWSRIFPDLDSRIKNLNTYRTRGINDSCDGQLAACSAQIVVQ